VPGLAAATADLDGVGQAGEAVGEELALPGHAVVELAAGRGLGGVDVDRPRALLALALGVRLEEGTELGPELGLLRGVGARRRLGRAHGR
jgi:hypothetical protein